MSVNISAYQLMLAGFADIIGTVLSTRNTSAHLLTLEITESAFVRDAGRAVVVLNDLKDIGVTLALDGFGSGSSSLSFLDRFPIDIVKIDQSFVASIERFRSSPLFVGAVVQLAHGLDIRVVAEGVETIQQHQQVARLGCDFGQGYYFARPMTAPMMETLHPSTARLPAANHN